MRMIMKLVTSARQRVADYLRERRIARLSHQTVSAFERKAFAEGLDCWDRLRAEIAARSPQQVARMEHRQRIAR